MATELKHTSGPWMAAAAPSSIVGWPIVGPMGRSIANVSWMPKPPNISDEAYEAFRRGCEANARLIAASPDLLEALQETVAKFDAAPDSVKYTALGINKCRAAIAKATGQ